jgi:hypothetical protein
MHQSHKNQTKNSPVSLVLVNSVAQWLAFISGLVENKCKRKNKFIIAIQREKTRNKTSQYTVEKNVTCLNASPTNSYLTYIRIFMSRWQ